MRIRYATFGLVSSLVLPALGCSDDDQPDDVVQTRVSGTADFASYRTFAFAEASDMDPNEAQSIPTDVSANLESVNALIRRELREEGLTEVAASEDPDLRAFSLAATNDEEAVYWSCVDRYWYWYWAPCEWVTPMTTQFTEGALFIGLVDRSADELVFSGLIQGVAEDPQAFAARIDEDVDEVFDAYPDD